MSSEKASFTSRDPASVTVEKPGPAQNSGDKRTGKASFYTKDPTPPSSDPTKSGKKKYMGEERRRDNRRKGQNRRTDVRFDPTKTDRRQSDGRRETDATVKFW
jgi:hypothetical protein